MSSQEDAHDYAQRTGLVSKRPMPRIHRNLVLALGFLVFGSGSNASAQTAPPPTQLVTVDGRAMRVATAGLAQRQPGQPVVILEAGTGETGIETWTPLFYQIAQLAPVLAYDRRGIGQSEPDAVAPTLMRVAESLHKLLQQMRVAPPYVLVGQSWGGVLARAFAGRYPSDVAGLVFIDVTDFESTREEKAAALPPDGRQRALEPPVLPAIPADTPAGLRAEIEQISSEMRNDYPQARAGSAPGGPDRRRDRDTTRPAQRKWRRHGPPADQPTDRVGAERAERAVCHRRPRQSPHSPRRSSPRSSAHCARLDAHVGGPIAVDVMAKMISPASSTAVILSQEILLWRGLTDLDGSPYTISTWHTDLWR